MKCKRLNNVEDVQLPTSCNISFSFKKSLYASNRRLVWPKSKSRYFGEEKDIYTDNQTTITAASSTETKRNLYQTAQ